ncbi:MAG: methyl-accepting chemotaxis protein [Lachnospiraceae bacterium]|nr:methyl-accepting chemotaxis protein [Lachnospiraceae bacterium]
MKKRNREKVAFLKSTKGRVIMVSIVVIVVIIVVQNTVSIKRFRDSVTGVTQNYMQDLAFAYGHSMDVEQSGKGQYSQRVMTADFLESQLKGVGVKGYKSSYAYLVSGDGTMLYHPTKDKIGKPVENPVISNLVREIKAGKTPKPQNATVSYNFRGVKKYAAYYIASDNSFILVVSADDSDLIRPVNATLIAVSVIGTIIGLAGLFILVALLTRSMRPISQLSQFVNKMADLDFSKDENSEKLAKRQDEFGVMARAIINLQGSLKSVIVNIKSQSNRLFESSTGMYKHAADMNETTNQVDTAVNEIAQGATSQASQTQNASENVITIGNMIEETNEEVSGLDETANKMKKSHQTAVSILHELGDTNEKTKESINQIAEQTKTTNESAGKIREATSIIANIADETNLLSLNASIEAARAGEAGRGFAVVASQIQQLADQSSDSAKQIEQIVDELIKDSDQAVATMDTVKEIIEQQSDNVDRTKTAFEEVSTGIDDSISAVSAISSKMKQMDEARKNVVETVSNLSAIAQENAASTEESSASVSSITTIADEIEESSGDLKNIAKELDNDMNRFRY